MGMDSVQGYIFYKLIGIVDLNLESSEYLQFDGILTAIAFPAEGL